MLRESIDTLCRDDPNTIFVYVYTQQPISATKWSKERPTAENSDVLNRNFDLSVIDHIPQLDNPLYSYTCRSCTLIQLL